MRPRDPPPRPIRRRETKRLPILRIPEKEALTPRLREKVSDLHLVGFHQNYQEKDDG